MSPAIRSAIWFSVVVVILTGAVIWIQKRWPEHAPQAEVALSAVWVVYFIRDAIKHDRARQSDR